MMEGGESPSCLVGVSCMEGVQVANEEILVFLAWE